MNDYTIGKMDGPDTSFEKIKDLLAENGITNDVILNGIAEILNDEKLLNSLTAKIGGFFEGHSAERFRYRLEGAASEEIHRDDKNFLIVKNGEDALCITIKTEPVKDDIIISECKFSFNPSDTMGIKTKIQLFNKLDKFLQNYDSYNLYLKCYWKG